MANDKGMPEDKRARLEAIRAANAAKKAQSGDDLAPAAPVAAASIEVPPVAVATTAAAARPGAVGANMPDDKKAKLEAIRAANAAKRAEGGAVPVAVAPVTAAPTAAAAPSATARPAAAPAPRPAARASAKPQIVEEDHVSGRVQLIRLIVGAIFGFVICVLLATMTGYYVRGAVVGIILGALAGVLVLGWPPQHTTGE